MIRYDALLVRALARELDERLRGRAAHALRLDPDARRASLELEDGGLVLELHPTRGWILESAPPAAPEIHRLHRSARVRRVSAPPDERLLRLELDGSTSESRPIRALVVELLTNQLNAVALDDRERIVAILWPRSAGGRELARGRGYVAPPPSGRQAQHEPLSADAWRAFRYGRDPAASLVRNVAWTSTLNAWALVTYDDYLRVVWGTPAPALVRRPDGALQPYPHPLGEDSERAGSLLDAMRRAAQEEGSPAGGPGVADPEAIDRVRREITRVEARIERLASQAARALPEAAALRAQGDVLLARLHGVPRGAARVALADFEGGTVEIALDPKLAPAANAQRLYDAARKRERAAGRLPALIDHARARVRELSGLVERAEAGAADPAELDAALPARTEPAGGAEAPALPYRRYLTSGGLEVRVGRSSRANDELTFHHSSPNDVWLHARDVAGAHVVLRWSEKDAGPPQRDLAEAAVLAALHSKSRTSGTVAVDWTRRKYVRKPRKAKPGSVLVERAKTVFVSPDPDLERRLRPS